MSRGTALKRESIEALRARLLADEQVRMMIEMRAYEIYRLRGEAPGQEAADWLQAEAEILKFLIEEETRRSDSEPLVVQSLSSGVSDQLSTPAQPGADDETAVSEGIDQTQPSTRAAETIERASPLGLADFLTDPFTGTEPKGTSDENRKKPHRSRSRAKAAKSPAARNEAGKDPARVKAAAKKTDTKKPSKKPKKTW